jgi:hypothetical protein
MISKLALALGGAASVYAKGKCPFGYTSAPKPAGQELS